MQKREHHHVSEISDCSGGNDFRPCHVSTGSGTGEQCQHPFWYRSWRTGHWFRPLRSAAAWALARSSPQLRTGDARGPAQWFSPCPRSKLQRSYLCVRRAAPSSPGQRPCGRALGSYCRRASRLSAMSLRLRDGRAFRRERLRRRDPGSCEKRFKLPPPDPETASRSVCNEGMERSGGFFVPAILKRPNILSCLAHP